MEFIYIIYYVFAFVLGLCIGSFLNVCIYRIPLGISVARGRSICPNCSRTLKPYDMVPVLSYIILGGKCRFCSARISPRYPFVELLGGVCFLAPALIYGFSPLAPLYMAFLAVLIPVAFIDAEHGIIPDRFHFMILALAIAGFFLQPGITWLERLIGCFAVSLPMLIIALATGGFGGGDIKLMAASGLLLGWQLTLLAFFIGAITSALYALIALRRKVPDEDGKRRMPFGPFLALGLALSALFGSAVIGWYLSLY
jgi:leader peptidase (prepilin peptidase)/N-methyltransferase